MLLRAFSPSFDAAESSLLGSVYLNHASLSHRLALVGEHPSPSLFPPAECDLLRALNFAIDTARARGRHMPHAGLIPARQPHQLLLPAAPEMTEPFILHSPTAHFRKPYGRV